MNASKKGIWLPVALVAILIVLPLALISTVSIPFAPPSAGSSLAVLPARPASVHTKTIAQALSPAELGSIIQVLETTPTETIVQQFHTRHAVTSSDTAQYKNLRSEGLRRDFGEIALAVLNGSESKQTLLQFLDSPDEEIRILAIKGLTDADGALRQNGMPALQQLWSKLNSQELEIVVEAASDTLIRDTKDGTIGNVQVLLHSMGSAALPAVPHLIWASDNHASADMRMWTMNIAAMLDPASPGTMDLIARRRADPNAWVRLEAFQATLLRTLTKIVSPPLPQEDVDPGQKQASL